MRRNRHIKNSNLRVINETAIRRFLLIGLGVIADASTLIALVGLTVIHTVTIITAYNISGFESALLAAIFPVFAEIYWFIKMWSGAGLINEFSVWIFGYIALLLVTAAAWFLLYKANNENAPSRH